MDIWQQTTRTEECNREEWLQKNKQLEKWADEGQVWKTEHHQGDEEQKNIKIWHCLADSNRKLIDTN